MRDKEKKVKHFKIEELEIESYLTKGMALMSIREMKNSKILEAMSEACQHERKDRDAKVSTLISEKK